MYICIRRQHGRKLIFIQIKDWLLRHTYDQITHSNPIFERLKKIYTTKSTCLNTSIYMYTEKAFIEDQYPHGEMVTQTTGTIYIYLNHLRDRAENGLQ